MIWKNRRIWIVVFGNNFSRYRYAIYPQRVPGRMTNSRCCLTLAASEHQEMSRKVEVTRRTLSTIAHSLTVHAIFSEAYIHFSLTYTSDHIFPVLPIKDLINEDGEPTTPFKLATGMKTSISHLRVLFCPCF